MKFSYNWLKELSQTKLTPAQLADSLGMHIFEIEEVKKQDNDFVFDIAVLPNRGPDCFSHIGIAREIRAIAGQKFTVKKDKLVEDKKINTQDFVSVRVDGKKWCPRYMARAISQVKVGPSPRWLVEKLEACGLRPINNIVDVANYVMLEMGQPLHAFDVEKLEGKSIIVKLAKPGEKITTLDDQKFDLDEKMLVIADAKKPVAIAGMKGGKSPEISAKTKTVILESANFERQIIRRASKKLNLRTDASVRFEHGLDPNLAELAINRAAGLIQKIAGGKIALNPIDICSIKPAIKTVDLNLDYLNKLLGIVVPEAKVVKILQNLDFSVKKIKGGNLVVQVPSFRLDISIPEDLIEEIGRIYGYEKIEPEFPKASVISPERNMNFFWGDKARDILKEAGLYETYNYSFISEKDARDFGFNVSDLVEIENPMNSEQKYMRPSLIIGLLKNVEKNQRFFSDIKFFELGKVFLNNNEVNLLSGVLTADDKSEKSFYKAKGVVDFFLRKMGVGDFRYEEYKTSPGDLKVCWWNHKKVSAIFAGKERIGFFGEISSRVLDGMKIDKKIIYFDINFEKLTDFTYEDREYRPISHFPSALRDLAVLVPKETRALDVLDKMKWAAGNLIFDIDLFDIYEGGSLPEGKKNLAFHIVYQADDRTLKPEEIEALTNRIIKALEENKEWEVRK